MRATGKPVEGETDQDVDVWTPLVRIELIIALVVMIGLTFWSIVVDAPLEEIANPTLTPNPAKAPWYFLGLQELLVYFDP
ncbi:MAG: cytochrome C, partial [Desulfobulbaceae bacterium]|nr:cytochrome C [Desulfobulbaceae bacterium]